MRGTGRWQLSDGQRLLMVIAVISALFLAAMSLGMQSIILLLVAVLLVVGAGLGVFMLGLRYNGRIIRHGSARVVMVSSPPAGKIVARCDVRVVVDVPGAAPTIVKVRESAMPVSRWPRVGMLVSVEADPRDPRQVRIRWDQADGQADGQAASPAEEAAAFAVPFFTEYADAPDGGYADPPSLAGVISTTPPPITAVALDESFPPAPGLEADPDGTIHPEQFDPVDLPARTIPAPRPAETAGGVPPQVNPDSGAGMGIMLIVANVARSVDFYHEQLAFAVVDRASDSAVLSHGGGRLLLRQVPDMSPVDRRVVHLHVEVNDVESAFQDLRAKGVEFVHRPRVIRGGDRLELWAATFRDPDGHAIALTEWRERDGEAVDD